MKTYNMILQSDNVTARQMISGQGITARCALYTTDDERAAENLCGVHYGYVR